MPWWSSAVLIVIGAAIALLSSWLWRYLDLRRRRLSIKAQIIGLLNVLDLSVENISRDDSGSETVNKLLADRIYSSDASVLKPKLLEDISEWLPLLMGIRTRAVTLPKKRSELEALETELRLQENEIASGDDATTAERRARLTTWRENARELAELLATTEDDISSMSERLRAGIADYRRSFG